MCISGTSKVSLLKDLGVLYAQKAESVLEKSEYHDYITIRFNTNGSNSFINMKRICIKGL